MMIKSIWRHIIRRKAVWDTEKRKRKEDLVEALITFEAAFDELIPDTDAEERQRRAELMRWRMPEPPPEMPPPPPTSWEEPDAEAPLNIGEHFYQVITLRTPDVGARWAMFHLRYFRTYIANAIDPQDLEWRKRRIFQLYIALVRCYYRFLRASNAETVANMWDALVAWRHDLEIEEPIEATSQRIPKPI
jgi:hypothetical protein